MASFSLAGWDPSSPTGWAAAMDLVSYLLLAPSSTSPLAGDHAVLLDGSSGSFLLAFGPTEDRRDADVLLSWAWSINVLHVLLVDLDQDQVQLLRWDSPGMSRRFRLPRSIVHVCALLEEIERSPAPKVPDVFLSLWKVYRSLLAALISFAEQEEPPDIRPAVDQGTAIDAVRLLHVLLLVGEQLRAESTPPNWRRWRVVEDALAYLSPDARSVCEPGNRPLQLPFGRFLESLIVPDAATGCLFSPGLFLRHAASGFYQLLQVHLEQAVHDLERRSRFGKSPAGSTRHSGVAPDTRITAGAIGRCLVQQAFDLYGDLGSRQELRLFDPACGSGTFLVEALRELDRREFRGRVLLTGIDILPLPHAVAQFCLWYATRERGKRGLETVCTVHLNDSLSVPWEQTDFVLMNPPFRRPSSLEQVDAKTNQPIRSSGSRLNDLSTSFVEKGLGALRPGGVLATMVPPTLLSNESTLWLREMVTKESALRLVGQFAGHSLVSVPQGVETGRMNQSCEQYPTPAISPVSSGP